MPSLFSIVIALSFLYLFACDYISTFVPIVSSLSTAAPVPSNHNVIRSYTFDDDTICTELLSPSSSSSSSSSVLDHHHEEEEDEVEYWYPTNRRYFEFSIPSILSTTTTTSDNDPTPISIRQTSFGCGKLGYELWDSSIALCLYLGKYNLAKTSSRVLELGSGVGLPSVVCRDVFKVDAILATDFWETDDDVFDEDRLVPTKFHGINLHYNVVDQQQQSQKEINNNDDGIDDNDNDNDRAVETAVLKLDWYDPGSTKLIKTTFRPDLIIGSDLMYYPIDVEPLLNTLEILLLQDENDEESSSSSPPENKNTNARAVLVLPLEPSKREAIPEFRSKLPARFSATHTVNINEIDFLCDQDSGEKSTFLTIDIIPKK
jgi:hypothetical protein